jgi:pimeloyl-ACP methyl ester carboxylesterase
MEDKPGGKIALVLAKSRGPWPEKVGQVSRLLACAVGLLLVLLACLGLTAQNAGHRVRNIVLVHGAWADGSGWKSVYDILVKDGCNVSIVQEPETTFKEDVAATKRVLALQDGPTILVAHSYGGAVITEAGTEPSVAGLVYIAAHMPDAGENEADDGKRFPSDLSFMSISQQTCLPIRLLSWRGRRCLTLLTISKR